MIEGPAPNLLLFVIMTGTFYRELLIEAFKILFVYKSRGFCHFHSGFHD